MDITWHDMKQVMEDVYKRQLLKLAVHYMNKNLQLIQKKKVKL